MEEKNKKNLQDALKKMPVYQPKENLWEELDASLDGENEKNRSVLITAMKKLPGYQAPKAVWSRIQRELHGRSVLPMYAKIAATITGLLILGSVSLWYIQSNNPDLPSTPAITSEKSISSALPTTKEEIVEFQTQMQLEEQSLRECLENLPQEESKEIAPAMEKLNTLTETRDSLMILLNRKDVGDAGPRLQSLETRRKALIRELKSQVCEKIK